MTPKRLQSDSSASVGDTVSPGKEKAGMETDGGPAGTIAGEGTWQHLSTFSWEPCEAF